MRNLDINDIREAIDPPPFSKYDAALPPYGSPLRARFDVLLGAAEYAVQGLLNDRRINSQGTSS